MDMKCPIDNSELRMTERHGVEIDYCPKCRGVWLDRGELDKIIDQAEQSSPQTEMRGRDRYDEDRNYREHDERGGKHGRKKREGFLSDLFEFGD